LNERSRAILALVTVVAAGCAPMAEPSATPAAALPGVSLSTLDGHEQRIDAALAGRPALISLWATWCDACAEERAPLGRLEPRARERGGVLLAIAVGEPRARVAEAVASRGLPGLQLVDEQFRFADALGQRRVPSTLVVDRAGRLVHVGGKLDERALEAFRRVLAAQPTSTASAKRIP
jgi:thiol-disulfide isomerase/thioredoxin